ncbi:MAG: insulinase family protein [Thermoplasmata archaeon]|nr:insulinase family protein [Thermoplasmata archaeon]
MSDPLVIERSERPSGLVVARQAAPAFAPSIAATFVAPAGYAYDPSGSEGLALLASSLASSGAGRRNRIELARELDRLGGTLRTSCHPESAEVTVWGPRASSEALVAILADVVLAPRAGTADLDRVRRQLYERQLRETSQPESRAERELFRAVFPPGHPYRLSGVGSRRSIGRIRRSDIARFHHDHFSSEGSFLVVTSARPLQAIARSADRLFAGLKGRRGPKLPQLPTARTRTGALPPIAMPGRAQVEIRMGGPSIARGSEVYPAAYLANEILGGRPLLARLFQKVREAHGLAYHASSELEPMRWGGHWLVQAGTGPERTAKVLKLLESEIDRIRDTPPSTAELEAIRTSAIGEIPLGLETTSGAHEFAVDVTYHGLPGDFYRAWPGILRSVRPSDVRRAAEIAFDATRAATIVVGPTV